jgi:Protein of unknown function (DUF3298).
MSLLKFASMTCIALTLGACQSVFQPAVQKPLAFANDASEQVKAGCTGQDCPLVNIDTLHFPDAPKLDALIENRLLRMTVNSPEDKLAPSLNAYREHFLRTADSRNSTYLQAKVREQHDGLVIVELSSYLDTGGAHGMPGRGFINYSRSQQKDRDPAGHAAAGSGTGFLGCSQSGSQQLADQQPLRQRSGVREKLAVRENPACGAAQRQRSAQVRRVQHCAVL